MIWRVEQLLKFVEIPFVYSLLIIPFSAGADMPYLTEGNEIKGINQNIFPLIFILGIVGGALSIIDPFGNLCKILLSGNEFWIERKNWYYKKKDEKNEGDYFKVSFLKYIKRNFLRHGINTLPINTEINKIVGMFYFVTLILFLWAYMPDKSYTVFTESFISSQFFTELNEKNIDLVKSGFSFLFLISIFTVIPMIIISLRSLCKKTRTAAIFLYGISHIANSGNTSVKANANKGAVPSLGSSNNAKRIEIVEMQEAMREGRWELAEEWSHAFYKNLLKDRQYDDKNKNVDDNKIEVSGIRLKLFKFYLRIRKDHSYDPI